MRHLRTHTQTQPNPHPSPAAFSAGAGLKCLRTCKSSRRLLVHLELMGSMQVEVSFGRNRPAPPVPSSQACILELFGREPTQRIECIAVTVGNPTTQQELFRNGLWY